VWLSLVLCVIYYVVWMYVLPHFGKYTVRQETIFLDNEGTNTHRLVRVPNHELTAWDAAHDATGKVIDGIPADADNKISDDIEKHK
jgi:hypothetical protein